MRSNTAGIVFRRWLGALALALWLAAAGSGAALAAEAMTPTSGTRPFRIALVPVIDATGGWLDTRTSADLMLRLEQELHIPLNNTMHWAEYISEDESLAQLKIIMKEAGHKAKLRDAMQPLASRLNADLVIAVEVTSFYERRYINWEGETVIETSARLTLHGYDAASGRLIRQDGGGYDINDYHPSYEAAPKLMEALEEALAEARIRSLLPPKRPAGQTTSGQSAA